MPTQEENLKLKSKKKQQYARETGYKSAYKENSFFGLKIICPVCKKITWFDNQGIPAEETYEVVCDNCNFILKRKNTAPTNTN